MRSTLVKGLSVAFAAAMAVTAFAPATVSEAASTKAYVVSKYVDSNGRTHKLTYDSRGRLTKEVVTNNGETERYSIQATNRSDLGTIEYVIKDGNGQEVSGVSTDYTLTKATEVANVKEVTTDETTFTYTYYNSGKAKDKKKSMTAKTTVSEAYVYDSTVNDNDGAYAKVKEDSQTTTYTYNSKGECTEEVNIETNNNNWVYTYVSGRDYEIAYNPWTGDEMTTTINGTTVTVTVNAVPVGTKYDDIKAADKYAPCFNGAASINKKNITTTTTTYNKRNSLGLATDVDLKYDYYIYTPQYAVKADGSGQYLSRTSVIAYAGVKGGNLATTYTKVGQPKKQTQTSYAEGVSQTIVTAYDEAGNGTVVSDTGKLKSDDADTVSTVAYTYDKNQQLSKKVFNGYESTNEVLTKLYAWTYAWKYNATTDSRDNVADASGFSGVGVTTAGEPINKIERTTTYNSTLKEDSGLISAKTSDVGMVEEKLNGKDNATWNWVETYTLKKISIPSSRATAVLMDRWQLQTDIEWK